MRAIRLRTEYLNDPVGIDVRKPRLMWNCEGGVKQTAYRIVTENWDSGRVESGSMRVEYPQTLRDRERVNWRVRLWDERGEPGEWSEAFFETGIRSWQAKWITGGYTANKKERYPVDCFRKRFSVDKPIGKARLYLSCAPGQHHRADLRPAPDGRGLHPRALGDGDRVPGRVPRRRGRRALDGAGRARYRRGDQRTHEKV